MNSIEERAKTRAYYMRLNGSTATDDENYFAALEIERRIARTYTLSYIYLNDLSHVGSSPYNYSFTASNDVEKLEKITLIINAIYNHVSSDDSKRYAGIINSDIETPEHFTSNMAKYLDEIPEQLCRDGYWVWNRFEKYYVVAFSLNFTRFEVYSKDCNKELIKLRDNDEHDPIAGWITDPDYNESPIVRMLQCLNKK